MAYFKARVGGGGASDCMVSPLLFYYVGTSTGSSRTHKLKKNDLIFMGFLHSVEANISVSNATKIDSHYSSGYSNFDVYKVTSDGDVTISLTNVSRTFVTYQIFSKGGKEITYDAISVSGTGDKTISDCELYDIVIGSTYNYSAIASKYPYSYSIFTNNNGSGTTYINSVRIMDATSPIINVTALTGNIVYRLR
jgi:hypothetical protein